jgi:hypothetical protein
MSANINPETLTELFQFYKEIFTPLYFDVESHNVLPTEVTIEINSAFSHVARYYLQQNDEREVVGKATSHIKRACLDCFKLKLKFFNDDYKIFIEKGNGVDLIDTGAFKLQSRLDLTTRFES